MGDPVLEHSTYTWDPVSATWIHEKGPEISPPPRPADVYALQSYFFDKESNEWIRTVLAPMGRELAAQWQGAHRIPRDAAAPAANAKGKSAPAKKSPSPVLLVIAVVIAAMVGGAGLVAAQNGLFGPVPSTLDDIAGLVPQAISSATAEIASTPPASASAQPSPSEAAATQAPVVAPTRAPAPPASTPAPAGAKLVDGGTATYTGPTLVVKPAPLAATLTVRQPNGQAATGTVTIVLGSSSVVSSMDGSGRVSATLSTSALAPGQYSLQLLYKGTLTPIASITVR